jgi:metal-sulfur cluster biosynthetic enzyme
MADIYGFEREKDEPDMVHDDIREENVSVEETKVEEIPEAPKIEETKEAFRLVSAAEIEKKVDKNIVDAMKGVKDPEINMDIWTLGLIYDIKVEGSRVDVTMTFTSPMCPFGPQIVDSVKEGIKDLGYTAEVEVVFNPVWKPSEEVKEMLGV